MVVEHIANPSLSVVVAKCWLLWFVVRDRIYVLTLYHNPDLNAGFLTVYTNINCCCVVWGRACLFPVCGWIEWPSSGVVGIYNHKSPWCCSLWLFNCVWLRSVGCLPDPCKWWKTWPPDDWCYLLCTDCSCSTQGNSDHSSLSAVISMAPTVPNLCVSRKVSLNVKSIGYSWWCNTVFAQA